MDVWVSDKSLEKLKSGKIRQSKGLGTEDEVDGTAMLVWRLGTPLAVKPPLVVPRTSFKGHPSLINKITDFQVLAGVIPEGAKDLRFCRLPDGLHYHLRRDCICVVPVQFCLMTGLVVPAMKPELLVITSVPLSTSSSASSSAPSSSSPAAAGPAQPRDSLPPDSDGINELLDLLGDGRLYMKVLCSMRWVSP